MRSLRSLFRRKGPDGPFRSDAYWRSRYDAGGNSGAGSYGRLAEYKAGVINDLVGQRSVRSVIEFGSGDGNQCSLLDFDGYVGVDISAAVVAACRERFASRQTWRFLTDVEFRMAPVRAEMAMSMDVIYHLIEDTVFEQYMATLFGAASRLVLIYSSDMETPTKASHVRHRRYSDWIDAHAKDFVLEEAFDHPYPMTAGSDARTTSFASFKLFARREGRSAGGVGP